MRPTVTALITGLLFGIGLVVSGMADPHNVLGFLTVGKHWNPSLLMVMGGALAISMPGFVLLQRRGRPWFAAAFATAGGRVDRRLLSGAALFGAGWGLAGYCPGPALVGLSLGHLAAWVFVPALMVGAWIAPRLRGI